MLSFVQVVAELNRNRQLAEYREHPALLARLPGFRVSLGFGLHMGWSIEGAIGSEFKIDASYLSPHVNIATRLSAVTLEYGVTIIMSEPLVQACSPPFRRNFRPVDHVKLPGTKAPLRLFTVDLHAEGLPVESATVEGRRKNLSRQMERRQREESKQRIREGDYHVSVVFDTDNIVRRMRGRFSLAFFQEFEQGYLNYEAGEWDVAERVLRHTSTMLPKLTQKDGGINLGSRHEAMANQGVDVPSLVLLEYMGSFSFKAPADWKGWRELNER